MIVSVKLLSIPFLFFLLTSCFIGKNCQELSDDPLAYRQCIASQGDKQAQYELGLEAYDAGDTKTALKWLRLSARPIPSKTPIYSPPVGNETVGTILMLDNGIASPGHPAAQALLKKIKLE